MFICYAHRGASEYAPENTFSSFYLGYRFGANGIETDVRRTKDGVLVLFHDDTLTRVAGVDGSIADYTYEELLNFRVRNAKTGETDVIVKFEDFCRLFGFRDLTFAIELKVAGVEADVTAMLDRYGMREKSVITSFDFDFISNVKKIRPDYRVGYLTSVVNDEILANLKKIGGEEICPKAKELTKEKVDAWHAMGFNVRAWGVSDEILMRATYDMGADGMTVNFPDLLVKYMIANQR